MEQSRILWESKELAASNQRLYSILKRAYSFYKTLKEDENKDVRDARRKELERFIEERKYEFGTTTHDMTRVVKCVFGVDRPQHAFPFDSEAASMLGSSSRAKHVMRLTGR